MKLLPYGDAGLLVELAGQAEVLALHAALEQSPPPGVVDLVPAARTLLIALDPRVTSVAAVAAVVEATPATARQAATGDVVEIRVRYDGPDLPDVAGLTGLSEQDVVREHTGQLWTMAFAGFAPGFAYLTGEHDRLRVPRRDDPRPKVPPGAVGLAGEFSGVYPRESPGGWQLIGSTDARMWDLQRDPPALLRPGLRVRFVAG